ncbi:flavin reductase family protein [Planobispora siamensis]|uniref:Flavin reductase n=1 Tax=Planobispora siamensis TaxID=936338 RepID=A0A8J3SFA3_9ACTN|nr:flavin reductase family protein [Planobispora siamensis]GIH91450.1 flavin reductase [Planobispora siamensis]
MQTDDRADRDSYRRAMGRFATGVAVVTTRRDDADYAMTINSLASVSLDPLLALFCVEKIARFHDAVLSAGIWGVSILPDSAEEVSRFFAHRGRPLTGQLDAHPHHHGRLGVALFDDALATLECRTAAVHDGGDHSIVVGEVVAVATPADGSPLLYHEGRYRRLAE